MFFCSPAEEKKRNRIKEPSNLPRTVKTYVCPRDIDPEKGVVVLSGVQNRTWTAAFPLGDTNAWATVGPLNLDDPREHRTAGWDDGMGLSPWLTMQVFPATGNRDRYQSPSAILWMDETLHHLRSHGKPLLVRIWGIELAEVVQDFVHPQYVEDGRPPSQTANCLGRDDGVAGNP